MDERIESFEDFWPYYLSEHRSEVSRRLHFVGTTGFLASIAGSAVLNPITFPLALAGFGAIFADALRRGESEKPSFAHVAGMVALPALASPIVFPAGVVFAYGCAWIGHFGVEKNRPATFKYPIWSLAGDFRMWSHMARGKLWKGDPLEELGLEDAGDRANGHAATVRS
jgi:hypothetical protein